MTKFLPKIFIAPILALLPFAGAAIEHSDNINHLLSKKQLAQYCLAKGTASNTRIKIILPTNLVVYGSVVCNMEQN